MKLIDDSVKIINNGKISIGDNTRIDAFCYLSGNIKIGNNVHIAPGSILSGFGGQIIIEDFCSISSRVNIFTASDDYSDGYMTNPLIPIQFRKVYSGNVVLEKHSIIGCGSVIMPNVCIGFGASVGALSFVNKNIESGIIVSGNPVRIVGKRNLDLLKNTEKMFLEYNENRD